MVKIILIKSPDEWATTKQVCRDDLVVYLSFSSHDIYNTSLYSYVLSNVLRKSKFYTLYIYIYIYIYTIAPLTLAADLMVINFFKVFPRLLTCLSYSFPTLGPVFMTWQKKPYDQQLLKQIFIV